MTARTCGDCQLCCRLLPTKEIDKPALAKCRHQCRKGCGIYERRPVSCRAWSCQWLLGFDVGQRPDRSHLVVDPMPDYVTLVPHDGSAKTDLAVVQVWIDPAYPEAHRDAAFRRWLDQRGMAAIIRYSSTDAFVLGPPSVTGQGWQDHRGTDTSTRPASTLGDVLEHVGDQLKGVVIRVTL